jgi:hypothetical protein
MERKAVCAGGSPGSMSQAEEIYSVVFACNGKDANFQLFNTRGVRDKKEVMADLTAALLMLEKMEW